MLTNKTFANPLAKLVLGVPIGSAKHQLGELICGGIVRDFRGQFISILVDLLLEITLVSCPWIQGHLLCPTACHP